LFGNLIELLRKYHSNERKLNHDLALILTQAINLVKKPEDIIKFSRVLTLVRETTGSVEIFLEDIRLEFKNYKTSVLILEFLKTIDSPYQVKIEGSFRPISDEDIDREDYYPEISMFLLKKKQWVYTVEETGKVSLNRLLIAISYFDSESFERIKLSEETLQQYKDFMNYLGVNDPWTKEKLGNLLYERKKAGSKLADTLYRIKTN